MSGREKKIAIALLILFFLLPFGMARSLLEMGSHIGPLWASYYGYAGYWGYTHKPILETSLACYGISSFWIIILYWGVGLGQAFFGKIKFYFGLYGPEDIKAKKPIADIQASFQNLSKDRDNVPLPLLYLRFLGLAFRAIEIIILTPIIYGVWIVIKFLKKKFLRLKRKFWKKKKGTKKKKSHRFAKWLARKSVWWILLFLLIPCPYTDPAATIAMKLKNVKYGLWYLLLVNALHVYLIVWGIYSGVKIWFF